MDFSKLFRTLEDEGEEFFLVRPGISIMLFYDTPVGKMGDGVAAILRDYLEFIAPRTPDKVSSPSGTYKRFTPKALQATLASLESLEPGDEFFEFHFGPDADGGSEYAVHFYGYDLDAEEDMPNRTNLLILEFPHDFLDVKAPDEFVAFVARTANRKRFHSGIAGYAFQHALTVLREESIEAIAQLALRYRGFDTSYDDIRYEIRGHIHNVSWLNLLGTPLVQKLGGVTALHKALPKGATLLELKHGVLVRVANVPIVGDVNRRAPDLKPLKEFAKIVKPLRIDTDYLGSDDELFAQRWLTRLD